MTTPWDYLVVRRVEDEDDGSEDYEERRAFGRVGGFRGDDGGHFKTESVMLAQLGATSWDLVDVGFNSNGEPVIYYFKRPRF